MTTWLYFLLGLAVFGLLLVLIYGVERAERWR
jgi:hypothetical protein